MVRGQKCLIVNQNYPRAPLRDLVREEIVKSSNAQSQEGEQMQIEAGGKGNHVWSRIDHIIVFCVLKY